ncbi:MAG TPA: hypothetical protein VGN26_00605 [Armatimonadota bacterium]|jgi:hypothetical protein
MPVRTEMKRQGSGCRFLMARHRAQYAGHSTLPVKDEIVALVCNQGRKIGWDDEEKCLASQQTCWKLAAKKAEPTPVVADSEVGSQDTDSSEAQVPEA